MKPTKEEYRQRTRPNVEEYDLLVLGSGEAGKLISWTVAKQGMKTADAIVATFAETLFGILLVLAWQTRRIALLSGVLLLLFAVTMTEALGIKAPLDFSVFSAAGGAFLLASCGEYPFSIDQL